MSYVRPSIIVDIDGTLANCSHRLHHIRNFESDKEATFKADWDAFYQDCMDDSPIKPTVRLVKSLADRDYCIILVTGRSGKYRNQTELWLEGHDIPYDLLLMRGHGDHTPDRDIKRAWLEMIRGGQIALPNAEFPTIALEDRKRVVDMWREEGLVCYQVDEGDF